MLVASAATALVALEYGDHTSCEGTFSTNASERRAVECTTQPRVWKVPAFLASGLAGVGAVGLVARRTNAR